MTTTVSQAPSKNFSKTLMTRMKLQRTKQTTATAIDERQFGYFCCVSRRSQ